MPRQQTAHDDATYRAATWADRRLAFVFDAVLLAAVYIGLGAATGSTLGPLFPLLYIAYNAAFTAWRGQTLGKSVFHIAVASTVRDNSDDLPWLPLLQQAILRALLPALGALVLFPWPTLMGIGGGVWLLVFFVPAQFDRLSRGLHDRVANTVVIDIGEGQEPPVRPPIEERFDVRVWRGQPRTSS